MHFQPPSIHRFTCCAAALLADTRDVSDCAGVRINYFGTCVVFCHTVPNSNVSTVSYNEREIFLEIKNSKCFPRKKRVTVFKSSHSKSPVRRPGIEPGSQEWESCMIPLHQRRRCQAFYPRDLRDGDAPSPRAEVLRCMRAASGEAGPCALQPAAAVGAPILAGSACWGISRRRLGAQR